MRSKRAHDREEEPMEIYADHAATTKMSRAAMEAMLPYYVLNFSERFRECVIDKFVSCYEQGITPNPCIDCNRYLKFSALYQRAGPGIVRRRRSRGRRNDLVGFLTEALLKVLSITAGKGIIY